ncbi:MAG: Cytochrome oxidase assembly [Alyxoria varia]|nr:MAG: Cytochrome oxidase assembly [Alyxoria varia]
MPWINRSPFPRNPLPSSTNEQGNHILTISNAYRRQLYHRPFLVFGLPFMLTVLAGSFFLTPATAVRYEKYDRKTHSLEREEAMGAGVRQSNELKKLAGSSKDDEKEAKQEAAKKGGKFKNKDIREEYWKLAGRGDKLDDWEPIRVERNSGEPDGTFD